MQYMRNIDLTPEVSVQLQCLRSKHFFAYIQSLKLREGGKKKSAEKGCLTERGKYFFKLFKFLTAYKRKYEGNLINCTLK